MDAILALEFKWACTSSGPFAAIFACTPATYTLNHLRRKLAPGTPVRVHTRHPNSMHSSARARQ